MAEYLIYTFGLHFVQLYYYSKFCDESCCRSSAVDFLVHALRYPTSNEEKLNSDELEAHNYVTLNCISLILKLLQHTQNLSSTSGQLPFNLLHTCLVQNLYSPKLLFHFLIFTCTQSVTTHPFSHQVLPKIKSQG